MRKKFISLLSASLVLISVPASAATVHTVAKGDTMWKIASKYQVGTSEVISVNSHIKNPDLIYPGDKISIPKSDLSVESEEKEVVRLVNKIRVENGLSELSQDWQLSRIARFKSQDMKDKNYFSHESPTYGSPFEMMKSFGITYRYAAENIAKGQTSAQNVVNAWMNSSGHRKNILNPYFTKIGVGYVKSGNYWTQMFIG